MDLKSLRTKERLLEDENQKEKAERRRRKLAKLRIIPLGGLGELGKNMTSIEFVDDIVVVD